MYGENILRKVPKAPIFIRLLEEDNPTMSLRKAGIEKVTHNILML